jgi:hypothetical protein
VRNKQLSTSDQITTFFHPPGLAPGEMVCTKIEVMASGPVNPEIRKSKAEKKQQLRLSEA